MELKFDVARCERILFACPRCEQSTLLPLRDDASKIDYCPKCKGVWVDFVGEKELLNIRPSVFTLEELKRLRKQYQPVFKAEPVRYINCPVCHELMNRKIWGSYSGVIVDRCEAHGAWYDEGKMSKIKEYVALGGVEYEKMRKCEVEIDNLNSRLNSEVHRLDQALQRYRPKKSFLK